MIKNRKSKDVFVETMCVFLGIWVALLKRSQGGMSVFILASLYSVVCHA